MKKIRHFWSKVFFLSLVVSLSLVSLAIFWSNLHVHRTEVDEDARRPIDLSDW
jgi:hypothetical protein